MCRVSSHSPTTLSRSARPVSASLPVTDLADRAKVAIGRLDLQWRSTSGFPGRVQGSIGPERRARTIDEIMPTMLGVPRSHWGLTGRCDRPTSRRWSTTWRDRRLRSKSAGVHVFDARGCVRRPRCCDDLRARDGLESGHRPGRRRLWRATLLVVDALRRPADSVSVKEARCLTSATF